MGGRQQRQQQRDNTPVPPGGLYDRTGRRISKVIAEVRYAQYKVSQIQTESPPNTIAMNESDSKADTCVLGANFHLTKLSGRIADVFGFRGDVKEPDQIHIVTGVTAFDHPDGYVILLTCLLYTSPSPRDATLSRMPSSA